MTEYVGTDEIRRKLSGMSADEIDALEKIALAQLAALDDSPESFAAFYRVVHGVDCPDHALEDWIRPLYKAHDEGKGIVIEAFRGSTKTTTITITFTAYRIGKDPDLDNLLIQVGDDIAADNTRQIADIIENNPGWKMVFPNVVPDKTMGWGAGGYEVMRSDMEYSAWRAKNTKRKDPTLVGVGYKSREIIGKHPKGCLIVDDIHDENNTSSQRELETVKRILTGTIFPTREPTTWDVFIGTPWTEDDALHYTAATGEYVRVTTPIYRVDHEGKSGVEFDGQKILLTWPEKFGVKEITRAKNLSGTIEFARMFLLDLTLTKNSIFKYMTFPHSELKANWAMVGGVDYASHRDAAVNKEGKGDFFAICYLAKIPGGGAVVYDGVIDHCTQAQGEAYIKRAQNMFPLWQSAHVESVGKGDDFIQTLMRNPNLRIIPQHSGKRSKNERLEKELSPWLENGTIRISDAETPFLSELRRELDNYPFHAHDDAMDALYYAARGIPDVLVIMDNDNELPEAEKIEKGNPWFSLGRR